MYLDCVEWSNNIVCDCQSVWYTHCVQAEKAKKWGYGYFCSVIVCPLRVCGLDRWMIVGGDSEGVGAGGSPSGVLGIFGLETKASVVL